MLLSRLLLGALLVVPPAGSVPLPELSPAFCAPLMGSRAGTRAARLPCFSYTCATVMPHGANPAFVCEPKWRIEVGRKGWESAAADSLHDYGFCALTAVASGPLIKSSVVDACCYAASERLAEMLRRVQARGLDIREEVRAAHAPCRWCKHASVCTVVESRFSSSADTLLLYIRIHIHVRTR